MAWTTPRTWTAGELVTASMMNTHVRDNLNSLRAVLDGTEAHDVIFFPTTTTPLTLKRTQAANDTGLVIMFLGGAAGATERLRIGYNKTGSGAETILTGETADGAAIRAAATLAIGAGGDNLCWRWGALGNPGMIKAQAANDAGRFMQLLGGSTGATDRGRIGFGKTGSGSTTIFTDETADSVGLRAEGVLHLGAGGDNLFVTLAALGDVSLIKKQSTNDVGRLLIWYGASGGTTERLRVGYGKQGSGSATVFSSELVNSAGIRSANALHIGANGDNIVMTFPTTTSKLLIGSSTTVNTNMTTTAEIVEATGAILMLRTTAADGVVNVGQIVWHADGNTTGAKQRVAYMECITDGATANDRGGRIDFYTKLNGATTILSRLGIYNDGNIAINSGGVGFGSGVGIVAIGNAGTNPSTNPTGGGILYSDAGAGKWRGSSGTVTTFGPAEPHCPTCGRDFVHEWESESYGHLIVCMWCLTESLGPAGVIRREAGTA